jgi:hypothetical protein
MEPIQIKDAINWGIQLGGFIGMIISMKIYVGQLRTAVFDETGSHRFVSYIAHDRMSLKCAEDRAAESKRTMMDVLELHRSVEGIQAIITAHNLADANRWAEVVSCLDNVSQKVEIRCKGIS